MAEKVETILRCSVFNTRPRDFYDTHILTTTQTFDKTVFADALRATDNPRGTERQIADVSSILRSVEESAELRAMWERYRKQFAYAADIEYSMIMAVLKTLMESVGAFATNGSALCPRALAGAFSAIIVSEIFCDMKGEMSHFHFHAAICCGKRFVLKGAPMWFFV